MAKIMIRDGIREQEIDVPDNCVCEVLEGQITLLGTKTVKVDDGEDVCSFPARKTMVHVGGLDTDYRRTASAEQQTYRSRKMTLEALIGELYSRGYEIDLQEDSDYTTIDVGTEDGLYNVSLCHNGKVTFHKMRKPADPAHKVVEWGVLFESLPAPMSIRQARQNAFTKQSFRQKYGTST